VRRRDRRRRLRSIHRGSRRRIASLEGDREADRAGSRNNEPPNAPARRRSGLGGGDPSSMARGRRCDRGVEFFGLGAGCRHPPGIGASTSATMRRGEWLASVARGGPPRLHSPPKGHWRTARRRLRSRARCWHDRRRKAPRGLVASFGHIHEAVGLRQRGRRRAFAANLGPSGKPARDLGRGGGRSARGWQSEGRSAPERCWRPDLRRRLANLNLSVCQAGRPCRTSARPSTPGQTGVDLVAVGYSLGLAASVLLISARSATG